MDMLGDHPSQWMFVAGIALLTFLMLRGSLRYYATRRPTRGSSAASVRAESQGEPVRRSVTPTPAEVAQWQVEMHELARELKGELDTKMRLLQLLIDQACCEAQRLQTLLTQAEAQDPQRDRHDADRQA